MRKTVRLPQVVDFFDLQRTGMRQPPLVNHLVDDRRRHPQEDGHIPVDEPFDPMLVLYLDSKGKRFHLWLSAEALVKISPLFDAKAIAQRVPSVWIGVDDQDGAS